MTQHPPHQQHCPECLKDKDVACPRNTDGKCLECGVELCAHHIIEHFQKVHCMDLNWRGFLKSDASHTTPASHQRIEQAISELEYVLTAQADELVECHIHEAIALLREGESP